MAYNEILFRDAQEEEVPTLVQMLVNDSLGKGREVATLPLNEAYSSAFQAIDDDPNHRLIVVILAGEIVGMMQLSYIPGLSRKGAWRGQIESVRVHADHRSRGLGTQMFEWAIAQCRNRGCNLVQLTSDVTRTEAHAFYDRLGFVASHAGYKLFLE